MKTALVEQSPGLQYPTTILSALEISALSCALNAMFKLDQIDALALWPEGFSWSRFSDFGVSQSAWEQVARQGSAPTTFFCHPLVLDQQPMLLSYYRGIAGLDSEQLGSIVGVDISSLEAGRLGLLDRHRSLRIARTVNATISAIGTLARENGFANRSAALVVSGGRRLRRRCQVKLGEFCNAQIRTILVNHLRREIIQVVLRNQLSWDYTPDRHQELIDTIDDVRLVRLKNGFHLLFSSEPDISLRNSEDEPLLAIEVKAGTDKAGALQRLGAGMKSFERDRELNPRVKTVYVVRAITPELRRRNEQGNPFDHLFGVSELLTDEKTQKTLANLVLRIVIGR